MKTIPIISYSQQTTRWVEPRHLVLGNYELYFEEHKNTKWLDRCVSRYKYLKRKKK